MNLFLNSLYNEFLKLKSAAALWLTILAAIFIPMIFHLFYLFKSTSPIVGEGINPWDKFFGLHLMAVGPLMLPLFIILLTSLVVQIEQKAGGLKNIFILPVPKWMFYISKITVVIALISFTCVLFLISILCSGALLGVFKSELNLQLFQPQVILYIKALFRLFIPVLGIIGIQFWLSFRIKNFVIPIGIGFLLTIAGITVQRAEEAIYFPYAYHLLNMYNADPEHLNWFTKASLLSLIIFILTTVSGYLNIAKMNVK